MSGAPHKHVMPDRIDLFDIREEIGSLQDSAAAALDALAEAAAALCAASAAMIVVADRGGWRTDGGFGRSDYPIHALDGFFGTVVAAADRGIVQADALPAGIGFLVGIGVKCSAAPGRSGVLCVLSQEPRSLSEHQSVGLAALGRAIAAIFHAGSQHAEGRRPQRQYVALAEHTSDLIMLHDRNGRRSYVSPAVRRILGYDQDEFMTLPVSGLTHPEDQATLSSAYLALSPEKPEFMTTLRMRRKDGTFIWVEAAVRLTPGNDGDSPIVTSIRDASRRKEAEEALRVSEERFRRSFDTAAHGMALVSLSGGMLAANPVLRQMLGYSETELLSTDFQSLTHPDDLEADLVNFRRALAGEIDSYDMEKRYLHRGGAVVWAHLSVALVRDAERRPLHFVSQVQDITEQKRAVDQLRESEARYRTLADNATDLIVLQEESLKAIYASPSSRRILGYEPEELISSTNESLVHPHDIDRFSRIVSSLSADRPRLQSLHRLRRKDGAYIWAEASFRWIPAGDGEPIRILSVTRDVTERKQAESDSAATSALMEEALNSMLDGVALFDPEDRLVFTNRALRRRSDQQYGQYRPGATYTEVIRTYLAAAETPLPADEAERLIANAVARHRRGDGVASEYLAHDGSWLSVRNVRMPGGRTLSVTTDVTAMKRAAVDLEAAKDAAQRLEALLRDAIEIMDDGIAIYDDQERLIVANTAIKRLAGWLEPRFVPGATFEEIIAGVVDDAEPGGATQAELRAYVETLIRRFRAADGNPVEQQSAQGQWMLAREFRTGGGATVALVTDITDLKRSAIAVEEARNRAEAANRAKSAFLASMSHEIRTPLSGIIGFADLLLMDDLAPPQRQRVTLLREAGESLLAIINDILDLSKIEAGKLEIERIAMRLGSVVEGAASLLRAQIVAKGLAFEVDHGPDLPEWIESDPTRIRQILLNLLSNAIKFTNDGAITIRTRLANDGAGRRLRFEVEDTGIGVPAEQRHRLFQDFSQVDASTARRYGGTGLGLAICQRLAEALGGSIGMEPAPERGSIFWFSIELVPASPPEPGAAPAKPSEEDARPVRVLVAEDLRMNQIIARGLLKAAGHDVTLVDDGAQAVAAVQVGRYDIVLMDMQMPEMDGLAATRAIRKLAGPGRDVPVVALTANAMSEDVERCLEAGMNDFLLKPIDRDALAAIIAKWAGRPWQ